jgi:triosephosphate isomerase
VVEGIRAVIGEREGEVRVLYGGSAGPGLWGAGGLGKAVDGMFLGRFAHEIDGFKKVVQEVEETLSEQ